MSVNKPTHIVPRDAGDPDHEGNEAEREDAPERPAKDPAKTLTKGSLLERAGGMFGLDAIKPARMPPRLDEDAARKFAPRRKAGDTPVEASRPAEPAPAPTPKRRASDFIGEAASAPTPAAPPEPPEPSTPTISFTGPQHEIVRSLLREQGLLDPDGGASTLLEEFRLIKRQVLATAKAEGTQNARRVLMCSPLPNEGKTFCAINLAMALAGERDSEVLLIDADFAKPSIMKKFGLEAEQGFMDVLADPKVRVEDCIISTDIPGLHILPAGSRTGRDSEYLASERTWEVLNTLTRGAPRRYLVFDTPPTLAATTAAELAKHVGQALLVARADMTGRPALEDSIDLLSACPDIRLLLNDATFSPSGRKFGQYYGYGE